MTPLTKSDLANINTEIKASNYIHNSDMKSMNDYIYGMDRHISDMIEKLHGTSVKTNKKDDKITELSPKKSEIIQN